MSSTIQQRTSVPKVVFKFKNVSSKVFKQPSGTQHPTTTVSGTFPTTASVACRAN